MEEYISYEASRDILKFEYTKLQSLESPESIHQSIKQTNYHLLEMQPQKYVDLPRHYMRIKEMDSTDISFIHLSDFILQWYYSLNPNSKQFVSDSPL